MSSSTTVFQHRRDGAGRGLALATASWLLLCACGAAVESSGSGNGTNGPAGTGATDGLGVGSDGNPADLGGGGSIVEGVGGDSNPVDLGGGGSIGEGVGGGGTVPAGGAGPVPPDPPPEGEDVGTKVIHRLSNVEYDNTIGELLGTDLRFGDSFVHEVTGGFDNLATALSMSPRQFDDYFVAARELAADVFADPALRERIVTCTPDPGDPTCTQTVLLDFGLRAFRRPLDDDELEWLMSTYQQAVDLGETTDGALQHVVHVVLFSPQFLYRIEFDPDPTDPTPHLLTAYELASRLSYALWSSMPDEALFAAAASGALLQPDTLRAEVDRMLEHPHSEMLVKNFAGQWLGARRLPTHVASVMTYPSWTPELAASMQQEMELYFSEFLYQDLPYDEFLTADFNFVDATLAEHYGMAPPAEAGFTRVEETTDQRRGFVGLAGFLTHTSRETRSSPVIRGAWVLKALLCRVLSEPMDLPVEPLPEPEEGAAPPTLREMLEAHRASPVCAACHDEIDPTGLALEHFDGIGRYRSEYEDGLPIDSTGTLATGEAVDSLISLTDALSQNPAFVPCAAERFNVYALGRNIADEAYLEQIVGNWTASSTTLRDLIKETVVNDTFRFRRAETQ